MLKMSVHGIKDGKPIHIIVLGLSHMNLDRLRAGQPILFDGSEVDLPAGTELMIFAGEDEHSMRREVAQFVGPNTKVKISPRLRD